MNGTQSATPSNTEAPYDPESQKEVLVGVVNSIIEEGRAGKNGAICLALAESIVVAVVTSVVKPDGYHEVLDAMKESAGLRLEQIRMMTDLPEGSA